MGLTGREGKKFVPPSQECACMCMCKIKSWVLPYHKEYAMFTPENAPCLSREQVGTFEGDKPFSC